MNPIRYTNRHSGSVMNNVAIIPNNDVKVKAESSITKMKLIIPKSALSIICVISLCLKLLMSFHVEPYNEFIMSVKYAELIATAYESFSCVVSFLRWSFMIDIVKNIKIAFKAVSVSIVSLLMNMLYMNGAKTTSISPTILNITKSFHGLAASKREKLYFNILSKSYMSML